MKTKAKLEHILSVPLVPSLEEFGDWRWMVYTFFLWENQF